MTIRRYCDLCDRELYRNFVSSRVHGSGFVTTELRGENVWVEIILGVGGTWNSGELCLVCTRTAVLAAIDSVSLVGVDADSARTEETPESTEAGR